MKATSLILAAVVGMTGLAAGEVQARNLGRMFDDSGLSQTDISTMEASAQQLLTPLGKTGDARRWSNARSGSNGVVTLARIEGACAELSHQFTTTKHPGPMPFRVWRCRSADGQWQISAGPQ